MFRLYTSQALSLFEVAKLREVGNAPITHVHILKLNKITIIIYYRIKVEMSSCVLLHIHVYIGYIYVNKISIADF